MDALLAAIHANLDDDAPRLVYADALQRAGDPRGEFIAVQCALAALGQHHRPLDSWAGSALLDIPDDDEARAARAATIRQLRGRENALLKAHDDAWGRAIKAIDFDFRYGRGFAESIRFSMRGDPSDMRVSLAALFAAAPFVRALEVWFGPANDANSLPNALAFFAAPEVGQLRQLRLTSLHDLEGLRALTSSKALTHLRRLELAPPVGDTGVDLVLAAPFASQLEALDLGSCQMTPAGARALAAAPLALRELELRTNQLGVDGVRALASSPHLAGLRLLALLDNRLGADGAAVLAGSASLQGLRALDVRKNRVGAAGAAALGDAFPALRLLDLTGNNLGVAGITALTAGAGLGALRELCLQQTTMDDDALAVLAASPLLGRLRHLSLRSNKLTEAGLRAFVASPQARGLATLNLNKIPIGKKTAAELREALPDTRIALEARPR